MDVKKYVKAGSVIKYTNGKQVTDRKDVLHVWGGDERPGLFQGTASAKLREDSELELLSAGEVVVELQKIGDAEVERPVNKMKKDRATGIDEVRVKMLVMAECDC